MSQSTARKEIKSLLAEAICKMDNFLILVITRKLKVNLGGGGGFVALFFQTNAVDFFSAHYS